MPLLTLYRLATIALTPCARPLLAWRAGRGKEDASRLGERLGFPSLPRPDGQLVWLHGASLGESLSLLPLIERFIQRGIEVLVTTGTPGSARLLGARLPAGAFHQYLPLDAPRFVARFLDHWRPDLALFAESEIWPNFVGAVHARGAPLVLVNARISEASAERWRAARGVGAKLFGKIDLCLAQDAENAARFLGLGAPRAIIAGNLKFDVPAPPADPLKLAALQGALGARPVFAAVSTHPGEEGFVLSAHLDLARDFPDLLTIVAPRDPARGEGIACLARERGLSAGLRSLGELPRRETRIYIADTIGELGLIFRSAGVVFMGRSLTPGGGHNPIEAAKFGCAILHGPRVEEFAEVYAELDAAGAAVSVLDAPGLARAARAFLSKPARMRKMGRAGADTVRRMGGASQAIIAAIEPYLAHVAERG
ncbi:MAG TPA: 3-deoxy-D-manno-octulosonic acid transferase [Methylocystis sp.]